MKKTDSSKLAAALLEHLLGFLYGKAAKAIYGDPVGNIFRGIIFNSSGFSATTFYPEIFVQPLYVPAEHFTLTIGKRLRGNWEYERGKEGPLAMSLYEALLSEDCSTLLEGVWTPQTLAENIERYAEDPSNPHRQRTVAYSWAVIGAYDKALHYLDIRLANLRQLTEMDPRIKWYSVLLAEISMFKELLIDDPILAKKQLDQWTENTRSNLRLPA